MARIFCPYCGQGIKVAHFMVLAGFQCPRCSKYSEHRRRNTLEGFSPVTAAPESGDQLDQEETEEAEQETQEFASLLTSPHECQQCKGRINLPTGRRRSTIDCPNCGNRTSIYAVLHRCRFCGTLLESPTSRQGQACSCPHCQQAQEVPRDVLERTAPDPEDDNWFGFDCDNCRIPLAANKEHVGLWVVCPVCQVTMEVPHWGYHLLHPSRPSHPLAALQAGTEIRCSGCRKLIPTRAAVCPFCGTKNLPG